LGLPIVPRLIVIKGADEGKQFEVSGAKAGIGRESSSRIRLTDTEVSRKHAELVRTPEGYRLFDIGSVNGTFVNNQAIHDVLLCSGDHIQLGQTVLVYSAGPPAPAAGSSDLADRISLIARQELQPSSIVQTIGEAEGSRILANPEQVEGPWLKNALANVMYQVTQAVSHIIDLNQLLERVMELIFHFLDADRGCIMLHRVSASDAGSAEGGTSASDEFEPKAVRWRDGTVQGSQDRIPVSRTIMEYVLREKKGILVSDVAQDERFQTAQSIVRCGIREIICVPMKGRHETLGVLYLDTCTPSRDPLGVIRPAGKFNGDHLALAGAIAHQAALAVEDTRYYHAMVQAERLAAIGQTVAALSHHIKNILQGLQSGAEILKMGLQDMDPVLLQQGWKNIEKNQTRVNYLVRDMLSYSKEREPTIEPTDLNAIVGDVMELVAGRARELGVQLTARPDESLPPVPADPDALNHALLNIVGNALEAVEEVESPKVTVRTLVEKDPGEQGGGWILIQVRDNGPGIPPEKVTEIFRPFVSSKGARGTGLGLAVSRKILREHGGDILVQSQPGQGSLFTLRLPLRSPVVSDVNNTLTGHRPLPPD
jgi:signal transduction histidine kinase